MKNISNSIESEIRLVHYPTGIIIIENSSRSAFKNREKSLEKLKELVPDYKLEDVFTEQFKLA